jgi:hypothetical protein
MRSRNACALVSVYSLVCRGTPGSPWYRLVSMEVEIRNRELKFELSNMISLNLMARIMNIITYLQE